MTTISFETVNTSVEQSVYLTQERVESLVTMLNDIRAGKDVHEAWDDHRKEFAIEMKMIKEVMIAIGEKIFNTETKVEPTAVVSKPVAKKKVKKVDNTVHAFKHFIKKGEHRAKVRYYVDDNKVIHITAKDYGNQLSGIFHPNMVRNDTDTQTDYFDHDHVKIAPAHRQYDALFAQVSKFL